MKNFLIKKTQRESLVYSNFQEIKYFIGKLLNIHNYFLRKKRISIFLKKNKLSKVQFGAGSGKLGEAQQTSLNGFLDTDIFGKVPIDINYKLPFGNNTLDCIFNSHLIEHIYQRKIEFFLNESFRVLKKGGILITATPTYTKIIDGLYGNNDNKKRLIYNNHEQAILSRKPTPARILNCLSHINYGHKFLLDFETYLDLTTNAGFNDTQQTEIHNIKDHDIKMFLNEKDEAFKTQTEIFVSIKD